MLKLKHHLLGIYINIIKMHLPLFFVIDFRSSLVIAPAYVIKIKRRLLIVMLPRSSPVNF